MKVAIAGAGIMGRMLAWHLSVSGHKVSLFDREGFGTDSSAAANTAAGMLTPYAELESAEPLIFELGMQSLQHWPEIVAALGIEDAYFQKGSLVVAHASDRADYQRFSSHLQSKLSSDQLANCEIDRTQLRQLEPELSDSFQQAMYFSEESWLRTSEVMEALLNAAITHGCETHPNTPVLEISPNQLRTERDTETFDLVIDCRGLGAKEQLPELRGVRGELIWLEAPDVNIQRLVRLMHPRYGLYVVPQHRDNHYIVGATQIESDDAGPITLRSAMELLSAAYSLHAGFSEARILQTKTNCRPALADNLPQIEVQDGLIRVNGLFRHGYLLAPVLAAEVMQNINQSNHKTAFGQLVQKAS